MKLKKILTIVLVLVMIFSLAIPIIANPNRTGGFTPAEETFGAVATAEVIQIPGNMNQLNITITIRGRVVTSETFMIPNNSAGLFEVGPYSVWVSTFGNTNIDNVFITHVYCAEHGHDWVEHVVPPTAGTQVTRVKAIRCPHNGGTNSDNRLSNFVALWGDYENSCPQFCPLGRDCPDIFPEFTGGGTRGYTTYICANGCGVEWTFDGYTPYEWGHLAHAYWRGGGVNVMPQNPFRFTFRHHCNFGAVWNQPSGQFGFTTWRYEYCMNGDGCGKHIDDASPADLYLRFRMPANGGDRGHATNANQTGNVGNWGLIPDEVIDRFIYAFNIVFEPIFEWHNTPLRPVWYELDMRDSVAWASGDTGGVALSWMSRNPWDIDCQTHEIVHLAQRYGGGGAPGLGASGVPLWIHESFTDYLRPYMGIFNRESGFTIPNFATTGNNWTQGYRVGAAWFRWIERHSEYWLAERNEGRFPDDYRSNFIQDFHNVIRRDGVAPLEGRGGAYNNNDHRQLIELTGFRPEELWAQYMEWSLERFRESVAHWRVGYNSLQEAAGSHVVNMNPIFVTGGVGFGTSNLHGGRYGNEGSFRLFEYVNPNPADGWPAGTSTKYCANLDQHGPFWAMWRYDEAFVATRLIIATANDNEAGAGRRMGDGWTLSGSNDGGETWTVIYTGLSDDYSNFNRMFFAIDLPDNNTAFQYYKLFSNTQAIDSVRGPEQRTIQLSVVALATSCCDLPICVVCNDCGICVNVIEICAICNAECNCECVRCTVCEAVCDMLCTPCSICNAVCDALCVACIACAAYPCECLIQAGALAIVLDYGRIGTGANVTANNARNINITGNNSHRLGTAYVTGKGLVNIAIPNTVLFPSAAPTFSNWGILGSDRVNIGQIIKLGAVVATTGTPPQPVYGIALGVGSGDQGAIVSNVFQGLIREVGWNNTTIPAGISWLFTSFDAIGMSNTAFGRLVAYNNGTFTLGTPLAGTMGSIGEYTVTVPFDLSAPIWVFPSNRHDPAQPNTANTAPNMFVADRFRLNDAEIAVANGLVSIDGPQNIYAMIWHQPGDPTNAISVVFIVDFRADMVGTVVQIDMPTDVTAIDYIIEIETDEVIE